MSNSIGEHDTALPWPLDAKPTQKAKATQTRTKQVSEVDIKYPPDEYGEELADNARVWQVYRDEATKHDRKQLEAWHRRLDVLLIFAGIFAGVATAFIIESYKQLEPDWDEYATRLLYTSLLAQAESRNLTAAALRPYSPQNFTSPLSARWVNRIWLCSLAVNLAGALLAILGKRWLDAYEDRVFSPISTAKDWGRRRVLYHDGLKFWLLPQTIAALPLMLYLAVFLFFAGLTVFFWSLDRGVAYILIIVTGAIVGFYACTSMLTYWDITCPFYVPIFKYLHNALDSLRATLHLGRRNTAADYIHSETRGSALDASMLAWLAIASSYQEAAPVAIYAIGALRSSPKVLRALSRYNIAFWNILHRKVTDLHGTLYAALSTRGASGEPGLSESTIIQNPADTGPSLNYLRVCRAIISLTEGQTRAPTKMKLPFAVGEKLGPKDLLWHVLSHRHPSSASWAGRMVSLTAELVRQELGVTPEFDFASALKDLDVALRRSNNLAPHPVHVTLVLELLSQGDLTRLRRRRLTVSLLLIHGSLHNASYEGKLPEQLRYMRSICAPFQVPGLPQGDIVGQSPNSTAMYGLDFFAHLLCHKEQYLLQDDIVRVLVNDIKLISQRLSNPGVDLSTSVIGMELLAFLNTAVFREEQWGADSLRVFIHLLSSAHPCGDAFGGAILNLCLVAVATDPVGLLSELATQFILPFPPACLRLLRVNDSEVYPWRLLCRALGFERLAPSSAAFLMLRCTAALAAQLQLETLPNNAGRARSDVLAQELFAPDCIRLMIRPILHSSTSDEGPDTNAGVSSEELSPVLDKLFLTHLPALAPGLWRELREAMCVTINEGDNAEVQALLSSLIARVDECLRGRL